MRSLCSSRTIAVLYFCALLLLNGFGSTASGQHSEGILAIKGYDAVAYFQAGKAIQGNESFSVQWHNFTWYFQNRENRDMFAASPERYAPQYDGYCAWAMTECRKAVTDPEVWKVVDGKLYLNCSMAAYEKWSKDISGNIKKADVNWLQRNCGK